MHVHWLGRQKTCADHAHSDEWRFVDHPGLEHEESAEQRVPLPQRVTIAVQDASHPDGTITVALALLGSLAGLARWFATEKVELQALDNGSGKLLRHLCRFGFDEPNAQAFKDCAFNPPVLTACCAILSSRCCPPEWRAALPPDDQLAMISNLD